MAVDMSDTADIVVVPGTAAVLDTAVVLGTVDLVRVVPGIAVAGTADPVRVVLGTAVAAVPGTAVNCLPEWHPGSYPDPDYYLGRLHNMP